MLHACTPVECTLSNSYKLVVEINRIQSAAIVESIGTYTCHIVRQADFRQRLAVAESVVAYGEQIIRQHDRGETVAVLELVVSDACNVVANNIFLDLSAECGFHTAVGGTGLGVGTNHFIREYSHFPKIRTLREGSALDFLNCSRDNNLGKCTAFVKYIHVNNL